MEHKTKRVVNIDLLKCISMLFIVIMHFYGHGLSKKGLYFDGETTVGVLNYVVSEVILIIANTAVDIFVMITGYFMILQEKMQCRKIARIWLQVVFYSVCITSLFAIFTDDVVLKDFLKSFIPIKSNTYWFATKYLALLALAPFIARLCKGLTQKSYLILLGVMIFITTEIFKFPYGYTFGETSGTNLQFFITLFLTGGYLRLYPIKKGKRYFLICLSIVLLWYFVPVAISYFAHGAKELVPGCGPYHSLSFYVAITFFLMFKDLKIKETRIVKFLSGLVPYTFGVYLIHDHELMRYLIWNKIIVTQTYIESLVFVPYMCFVVLIIYMIGVMTDFIRKKLFDIIGVEKIINKIPI